MENQAYISRVHLKGYKSIRDLEIDLKPGLNIIIGPNGSGKTNFLEFLDAVLSGNQILLETDPLESTIHYSIKNSQYIHVLKGYFTEINDLFGEEFQFLVDEKIYSGKKVIYTRLVTKNDFNSDIENKQKSKSILITRLYFDNPLGNLFSSPMRIILREMSILNKYIIVVSSKLAFFNKFIRNFFDTQNISIENEVEIIKNNIFRNNGSSDFIETLRKYTPIENLELNVKATTVNKDIERKRIDVQNIFIQFKVNGTWLSWSQLSDGTKRLFYLFCGVFFDDKSTINSCIGIEEPELGIHPDQLKKLMQFLKEQAKEKQIIITTHSPQVLNILSEDELAHIITTRYDAEKGTRMHHLTEEQKQVARNYIEEGLSLGDAWVYSTQFEQNTEGEVIE